MRSPLVSFSSGQKILRRLVRRTSLPSTVSVTLSWSRGISRRFMIARLQPSRYPWASVALHVGRRLQPGQWRKFRRAGAVERRAENGDVIELHAVAGVTEQQAAAAHIST